MLSEGLVVKTEGLDRAIQIFWGREVPFCSSDCRLPSGGHQSYVRLRRLKPDMRTTWGLSQRDASRFAITEYFSIQTDISWIGGQAESWGWLEV